MPEFAYVAVGPDGQRRHGTATAANEDALATSCASGRSTSWRPARRAPGSGSLPCACWTASTRRDVIFFTSQLSAVIGAGVNLVDGLRDIEAPGREAAPQGDHRRRPARRRDAA